MAMTLFGTKVRIEAFRRLDLLNTLSAEVAKRSDERKILENFLLLPSASGVDRFAELTRDSEDIAKNDLLVNGARDVVVDYVQKQMGNLTTGVGVSIYRDLVLQVIEKEGDKSCRIVAKAMRQGKSFTSDQLPASFPVANNKAETLLQGKIRSEVGDDEYRDYLCAKRLKSLVCVVAKDLFTGVNNGLDPDKVLNFMGIMYELRKLETAVPTNTQRIKNNIIQALMSGSELKLLHIKCLRFTYPEGNRLQLIEHSDDVEIRNKGGEIYRPVGEKNLIPRLVNVGNILEAFGVRVRMIVLLSDQDLLDYFPNGGGGMVPDSDLAVAKGSLEKYKKALQVQDERIEVIYLRNYLRTHGSLAEFDRRRNGSLRKLTSRNSFLSEGLVESRVNYRFESNRKIFVNDPGRHFARERVNSQLASMLSLGVLGGQETIVVEEDRGEENKLVGGTGKDSLPVVFIKLRDII